MLTTADINRAVQEVQTYWGSHMYVKVMPGGGACMDWRTVELPEESSSWTYDQLLSTLLHEWGHRMISPISPQRGAIWRKLSEKQGVNEAQAKFIVNLATDAWIDYNYLKAPEWQDIYLSGLSSDLSDLKKRRNEERPQKLEKTELIAWLVHGFYHLLFDRLSSNSSEPSCLHFFDELRSLITEKLLNAFKDLLSNCWDALYESNQTDGEKIIALTNLLKSWFPETPPETLSLQHVFSGAEKSRTGWTTGLINEAMRAGLGKKEIEELIDTDELHQLVARQERLRIYENVVPVVRQFLNKAPKSSFSGYKKWRLGRPLIELDMLATLQRSGRMVPSVNTLSRHYEKRGTHHGLGCGCVIIIIDDSGSTDGDVLQREKEVAFAVIAAARHFGDPVGCIVFGDEITHKIDPTTHYSKIEDTICSLDSYSGGTNLTPALKGAHHMISVMGGGSVMLMTDAEIYDVRETKALFRSFPTGTRFTSFCFNDKDTIKEVFGDMISSHFKVLSASANTPFAETALEEIYG